MILLWTIDALLALHTVHDPQLTRSGDRIAYVTRHADLAKNRYLSTVWQTKPGGKPEPLPGGQGSDAAPRWSPDGRQLAFVSRRRGTAQVYLAPGRVITESSTGIESYVWSPDGTRIAYIAPLPLSAEEQRKRAAGYDMIVAGQGHRDSGISIVTLRDGAVRTLPIGRHILSLDWSPRGEKIVYSAQKSAGGKERFHSDLYEYDLGTGQETPLAVQAGQDLTPSYSRDGRWVAFHSMRGMPGYFGARDIGIVASGGGPVRYVTEKLEGDVFAGARNVWWSGDSREIRFGAGQGTSNYLFAVNIETGEGRRLPQKLADLSSFSISDDGGTVASIRDSALFLNETALLDLKPRLPAFQTETVRWKSRDGLEVEGVLRYPPGYRAGTAVPLLTILHGGPTGVATENFPTPRMYPTQAFLQEGFAVFEPNFRGSINYGPRFRTPTIQSQGYGDMDDVMTGVDSLIERGIADPQRLGLMGWSYGGFLTSWMITKTNRFQAASLGGCSMDWVTYYGMAAGGDDGPTEVLHEYFGGKPWDRLEAYYRHSQRPRLSAIRTPTLLLRGERDLDNVGELYQALTDLQVPTEFVTYPREPHSIGEPAHQRDMMMRNLAWFQRWVKKQ